MSLDQDKQRVEWLLHQAKCYGWSGDYIEVARFVQWVYEQYGLTPPTAEELEPVDP